MEAEECEVKTQVWQRRWSQRDGQTNSSEISSVMIEETEELPSSKNKDKGSSCIRQHCTKDEEEEGSI